ncbi:MAG TPA: hypothetical protein PKD64_18030 [Pirellulaceae bacterium]|nr:hypothetical protein [Pirellulaceae bacterium]HMP70670.1 hypothetical protein [Pirellulaceae bacterium]
MSRKISLAAIVIAATLISGQYADAQHRTGGRQQSYQLNQIVHPGQIQHRGTSIRGIQGIHFNTYNPGVGFFGSGFVGGGFFPNSYNSFHRPGNLPYFAEFPPVYYSKDIVRRPYGVSPYAVPPGMAPIESSMATAQAGAVRIINPYVSERSDMVIPPPALERNEVAPPALNDADTDDNEATDRNEDSNGVVTPSKSDSPGWEILPRSDQSEGRKAGKDT